MQGRRSIFLLTVMAVLHTSANNLYAIAARSLEEDNPYTTWALGHGATKYNRGTFLGESSTDSLSNKGPVAIHWSVNRESSILHLAVAVRAEGWVGLGFSEMGGMPGSDMFIFQASEPTVLLDTHATDYARPELDEQQDWTLLSSIVKDGFIIVEAERKLDTGDAMDWTLTDDSDLSLPGTRLIAAWGDDTKMHYHGPDKRAQGSVRFFYTESSDENTLFETSMKSEAEGSVNMKMDKFRITHRYSTWYENRCFSVSDLIKDQKLPSREPLHIIGFEWLIDPVAKDIIHHILVYFSTSDKFAKCNESGPNSVLATYQKGQEMVTRLPIDVGLLFADESGGTENGIVPKVFRLEVHYENTKKKKGVVDSSGVRIHYTSKLRKHTGAVMELGDPLAKLIGEPIGKGIRRHSFNCPGSCTSQHVKSNEGITVLYELFHMHTHGLSLINIHRRDNKEIRRGTINYFDFSQGNGIVKQEPFQVLPGDSFETQCIYEGNDKLSFGYKTQNEMCLVWMLYYPASVKHLKCTIKSETGKECDATHSSLALPNKETIGRKFSAETDLSMKVAKALVSTQTTGQVVSPSIYFEGNFFRFVVALLSLLSIFLGSILVKRIRSRRPKHKYDLLVKTEEAVSGIETTDDRRGVCPVSLQAPNTSDTLRKRMGH